MTKITLSILFSILLSFSQKSYAWFFSESNTPTTVVKKMLTTKSLLGGGNSDLSEFLSNEFLEENKDRYLELVSTAQMNYSSWTRISKLFGSEIDEDYITLEIPNRYLVNFKMIRDNKEDYFNLVFEVICANDEFEECKVSDIKVKNE